MPTFRSFDEFASALTRLATDLDGKGAQQIARGMGPKAQSIARKAAAADLGSDIMHTGPAKHPGWRVPLDTKLWSTDQPGVMVISPTRYSAGPWTVAQQGRNQGDAKGFSGPGINRKTGVTARTKAGKVRKVRAVQARRWNGTTRGKGTADAAVTAMQRELPKVAEAEYLKVLGKHFDVG